MHVELDRTESALAEILRQVDEGCIKPIEGHLLLKGILKGIVLERERMTMIKREKEKNYWDEMNSPAPE